MAAKRVFQLNEASIIDLKAELIRKESQFKREKFAGSEQKINRQPKKPPVWAKVKKENKVVNSGTSTTCKQDELSFEEQQALQKSRQALEAKAALYEKMARGEIEDEDEGEEGSRFLVDFHKKVYSKKEESDQDSVTLKDEDIPPPSGPEEEWVDYVDSLGRARRCLRKDLKQLQEMDKDMSDRKSPPTLLSEDMRRELMRQKWEKEEEEAMNKPVGPVHYQDIRFDEIRNLGVGYYQFSNSEEERQEQMKTLDKLREQTMEQRVRSQKLKDKRKAALDARLVKVRERKLKKLKASGELGEEATTADTELTEEKEKNASDEKTTVEQGVEKSSLVEDKREEEKVVSSRRPERKADLPEWAQHKIKQTDRPWPFTRTDPRSERDEQFAPPAFYYDNTGEETVTNNRKEPPKLFKHENKVNDKRQEQQNENRETAYQCQQIDHQPRQIPSCQQNQFPQTPPPPPPEFPPLPPPPQEYVQPSWTGYQWQPPPNMPPPLLPHQLPWQPRFPVNVPPPPPSLWQPNMFNMPPWQPPQGPPSMGIAPFPTPHVTWSESAQSSNTSLPGTGTESDCNIAMSSGKTNTNNIEQETCRNRTVPSTQELADFVAQFRSSS